MEISYPTTDNTLNALTVSLDGSLDFIILATGVSARPGLKGLKSYLEQSVRALKDGGLLFVQGTPETLPEIGVYLDGKLTFKYWIAVESEMKRGRGLPSVHAGILLFAKGDTFPVKKTRFSHESCSACGKSLKDWGGKTHLMHPDGHAISDVWTELPVADNHTSISDPALQTILRMVDLDEGANGVIGSTNSQLTLPLGILSNPMHFIGHTNSMGVLPNNMVNVIHCGDALEILRLYPDNCVDLVFADPPYNLKKDYSVCKDGWADGDYISWCNEWLTEYARVLKPTGSLFLLNLPRWTMYHADFLNKRLCFQNWIVWNALSDPRGKLMPAHYGLLWYTKNLTGFTFNYDRTGIDARDYCLRASCKNRRKKSGNDRKEPLTDIWSDIHRIRHKRDRDYHPCQLPDALLKRIINLSTNEGDIVLDALCGAGTTPVIAARLGRQYIGIDIDESYVDITRRKIAEIEESGNIVRASTIKMRLKYTKKDLQLELRDLAARLGRLPTHEDIKAMSRYSPDDFMEVFPSWNKALEAAKLIVTE